MKIWWVKRLCENGKRSWQSLATYRLKASGETSVFHSNLKLSQISKMKLQMLPDFLQRPDQISDQYLSIRRE